MGRDMPKTNKNLANLQDLIVAIDRARAEKRVKGVVSREIVTERRLTIREAVAAYFKQSKHPVTIREIARSIGRAEQGVRNEIGFLRRIGNVKAVMPPEGQEDGGRLLQHYVWVNK